MFLLLPVLATDINSLYCIHDGKSIAIAMMIFISIRRIYSKFLFILKCLFEELTTLGD